MSFPAKIRLGDSIAFRLTLLYAVASTAALVAVLVVTYIILDRALQAEIDNDLAIEVIEYEAILATQGMSVLEEVLDHEVESEGIHRAFNRVLTLDGFEVASSDMSKWPAFTVDPQLVAAAASGHPAFTTLRTAEKEHPVRILYNRLGPDYVVQIGLLTDMKSEVLVYYRRIFLLASCMFVVVSLALGGFMARRALGGVRRVTETAGRIAAGDWESRVPPGERQDEVAQLARTFNHMIDRIHVLVGELRDVTDDIAHDLRTPIARIRVAAESCFQNPSSGEESRELAGSVLEECERLLQLINTMLEISQTEAGARTMDREHLDFSAIAEDVCELFRPAAEDKGISMEFVGVPALAVAGDRQRLSRAVAHVVDNAIKYTGSGGSIEVICERRNGHAVVSVRDSGIGIPEAEWSRVFDRFYRVDDSRSGTGSGLGLSASRAITAAHGGDIGVQSVPGKGSTFEIRIPAI